MTHGDRGAIAGRTTTLGTILGTTAAIGAIAGGMIPGIPAIGDGIIPTGDGVQPLLTATTDQPAHVTTLVQAVVRTLAAVVQA